MLEQLVTDPTHVRGNTLDLICTNAPGHVEKTEIFQPGLSDHNIVTATLKQNTSKFAIKEEHTIRLYKNVDQLSFHKDILQLSKDLEEMDDPNDMWLLFTRVLKESIETHIPTKKVYYNKNQPCWFGKKAQKLVTRLTRNTNKLEMSFSSANTNLKEETPKRKSGV